MRQRLDIIICTNMDPGFDPNTLTEALKEVIKAQLGTPKKNTHVEYEPGDPE